MKEKDPKYLNNARSNKKIATRCRVCGGQLMLAHEIKIEMHERCNKDSKNTYMM